MRVMTDPTDKPPRLPSPLPVVGVPCCATTLSGHPFHIVGDKYLRAVSEGAGALPLAIPALGTWYDFDDLLARLDGLLITGSRSNVEPHHYGGPASRAGTKHDAERDATNLPLIRKAVQTGVPVLAICRGIQELNVALGGTLHQEVHALPGRADHRGGERPVEEQYGPAHPVRLIEGGRLAALFGTTEIVVNSLHAQGIDRPSSHVAVEAVAPDGQIEAVHVIDAPAFAVGVQWHPEWRFHDNPQSVALFRAFGEAVRQRAAARG
jgi:putative glutamine amidotransferase